MLLVQLIITYRDSTTSTSSYEKQIPQNKNISCFLSKTHGIFNLDCYKTLKLMGMDDTSKYCAFTSNNKYEKDFTFNSQDIALLQVLRC